jgi:hypothetical protein
MKIASARLMAFALVAAACSATSSGGSGASGAGASGGAGGAGASGGAGGAGASGGAGGAGTGGGIGGIDVGGMGGGAPGDCTDEANKLIYVVSTSYEFYRYSPLDNSLSPIGQLNCPAGGATPFSMAVDRDGVAWVLHNNGQLFQVSTVDASCQPTSFQANQVPGFDLFGMGFVSDQAGGDAETLFVGSYSGVGLGKVSMPSLQLSVVGAYDQVSGAAEITGTGDGKLYGFFATLPVTVAELDKTNAHVLQKWYPNVDIGSGWAFAAWGGAFYLFTAPFGTSQIDRFDPVTNQTVTVVPDVGFTIVGAGVSTCAPVTPPN